QVGPPATFPRAPSCFGATGSVLLEGLSPASNYVLQLAFFDASDVNGDQVDYGIQRIVSAADFSAARASTYLCMGGPRPDTTINRRILDRARELCAGPAPAGGLGACVIDFDDQACASRP